MNDILNEYFDVKLIWKNNIPNIKLVLKKEKRITDVFPVKCIVNGKRISKTGIDYYIHYLGRCVGKKIYEERKKYFSKYSLIDWYIKMYNPKDGELLIKYVNDLKEKSSSGLKRMYKSEYGNVVRKKQSRWSKLHADEIGERNKKMWSDPLKSEEMKKNWDYSYKNHGKKVHDFYEKNKEYILEVMNKPDRVKKISKAAKKMWESAKIRDLGLVRRMLNSSKNKNYELNGYKMNSIEYQVGLILNELKLNWKYESIFNFKKNCYLPDFSIESSKLIIECYGDFWHANPKYFKSNDTTHKTRTATQVWEYDERKKKTFEDGGYKYLYFWEEDISDNTEKIKEKIIYENNKK